MRGSYISDDDIDFDMYDFIEVIERTKSSKLLDMV